MTALARAAEGAGRRMRDIAIVLEDAWAVSSAPPRSAVLPPVPAERLLHASLSNDWTRWTRRSR